MKFLKGLFCTGLILCALSYADTDIFEDSRDGKVYHTVNVGDNVWLSENLRFESKNSYCYNNESSCDENGRLYTWEVAMNACPDGWRLPTDQEWNAVLTAQGGWQELKKWNIQIPMAGDRRADGVYHYVGESAFFWSATPSGKKYFRYKFDAGKTKHDRAPMVDGPAYSVKCVSGKKPCSTPLMNAVRNGDVKKVKKLLDAGALINESCTAENEMTSFVDYEDISYLGMAIDRRNMAMIRLLLDRGADPNVIDVSGPSDDYNSILTRAMQKGDTVILKVLLDNKAKVGFCDIALSSYDVKDDVLKIVVEKIDVEEINQCWLGLSLVDIFYDRPVIQKQLMKRGGKSGAQVCQDGPDGDVANSRMCGD